MPTSCQNCEKLLGEPKLYLPDSSPMCNNPADETACKPCQELTVVDEVIEEARAVLREFEEDRQVLYTQMNEHHDRLISRFPLEIAAEIFWICLPSNIMDKDLQNESSKHILAAPLVLSAVCRKWRAITCSIPRLWMDVPIHLQSSNLRSLPFLAKDWLKRSGQLPLSINLSINSNHKLPPALISPLIAVLNEYSTRWEQLQYNGPSSLLSQFTSNASGVSPLKTLKLKPYFAGSRNLGAFKLGALRLRPTNLLELSIIQLNSVSGVDWKYLTRINLNALSIAECLEALRRAPNLTHCNFSGIVNSSSRGVFPNCPNPLVCDKIKHLELSGDVYKEILKVLQCPSLRTCKVHANGNGVNIATLASFFEQSSCRLKSLSFLDVVLHTNEIRPLISSVPALHHFHISISEKSGDSVPRALLSHLAVMSTIGGVTAPVHLRKLRSFSFCLDLPLEWTLLVGCLVSPSSRNCLRKRLNCITIAICSSEKELQPCHVVISRDVLRDLLAIKRAGLDLNLQVGEAQQDLLQMSVDYHTSIHTA